MAAILTSEWDSHGDIGYKIVIDSNKTGSPLSNTFKVASAQLRYNPETDKPTGQIISSTLEFTCWNEGGYFNSTFIPSLVQSQQQTYRVLLYKDTGSGYELEWFGWIIQDITEEQEAAQPYQYKITAVDGLSKLKTSQYDNSNSDAAQTTPFQKLIIQCLAKGGLQSLLTTSDPFLVTSCDYWEDSMTYGATIDPLSLAFVDVRVWNIFNEYWEREYITAWEVLSQICVTYGARLYLSNGAYRFEQYVEREDATFKEVAYAYNYTQLSTTAAANRDFTLATSTDINNARAANNQFNYLPAIKRCEIDYERLFLTRDFGQFNFTHASNAAQDVGYLAIIDETGLNVLISYFGIASGNLNLTKKTRFSFYVVLSVDNGAGTTYYWDGTEWTTSSTQVEIRTTPTNVIDGAYLAAGNFNLVTVELPVDGDISIRVYLNETQQKGLFNDNWTGVTPTTENWTAAANVSLEDGEFYADTEVFYATTTNASIGDNEILNQGKTNIADGELQTGKIWVKSSGTSGTISKSDSWRIGNTGTYQRILDLTVETIQGYYHEPLKLYDGTIYCSESFSARLSFNSEFYLFLNCTQDLISNTWDGRWWRIDADLTGISSQTKLIRRRQLFSRPTANANAGELPNGSVGGVEITEGAAQIDGVVEFELTSAMIAAGQTGTTMLDAQGSGTLIDVTHVTITPTSGTTPYATASAQIYFSSETTTVVDSTNLLDSINNGTARRLTGNDAKLWENEALLFDINADATGDYDFLIKVYYKLIS